MAEIEPIQQTMTVNDIHTALRDSKERIKKLLLTYQKQLLSGTAKQIFIVLLAPSGSGKSTFVKLLLEIFGDNVLSLSISATSRDKRPNETHGKEYYFLTPDEFKRRMNNGDFIEGIEVYPNQFYGTLRSEIDRAKTGGKLLVLDIEYKGAQRMYELYRDANYFLGVLPQDMKNKGNEDITTTGIQSVLQTSLTRRGDTKNMEDRLSRVAEEKKAIGTLVPSHFFLYNYFNFEAPVIHGLLPSEKILPEVQLKLFMTLENILTSELR